jgi:hypothetical protein
VLVLALAAPAAAQGTPGPGTGLTGGLFGVGVSFLNVSDSTSAGFTIDYRKNVIAETSFDVGVVGDLGWHRDSDSVGGFDTSSTLLTLMGGGRITASKLDKVAPFGQVLFGMARISFGGDVCDIDETFCESDTQPAISFGGGVDVRLSDRFNVRGQVDFLKVLEEGADVATRFFIGISTVLGGR